MAKRWPPEAQRLTVLALLLLWCSALLALRIHRSEGFAFAGLWWNLWLALVPLLASTALKAAARRRRRAAQVIWFCLWLLFLPNAPYLMTDVMHLTPMPAIPLWYDLALLLSSGGTGLFCGYLSLLEVHGVVEQELGAPLGWIVALGSLLLCGFGIFLGRVLGWNSWDAITNPRALGHDVIRYAAHPGAVWHTLAFTLVFGGGLILGYAALRVLTVTPASSPR